ncbi:MULTISPECIES: hypothetical protein [Chelativorans]|jgi:hypothetical protein|uniref:hypothetical protein n=1 Tax=Chelativorans TaxID=449972 RepID=UPI00003A32A1|nr:MULTISPECIES: hypothetical protein [Chelativorans]
MQADLVSETAFAIYQTWSRERDPDRARRRFEALRPAIRDQFEAEAKAAIRVVEAFQQEQFA